MNKPPRQPPTPPPSTETKTTTTASSNTYLSTHLFVPYFTTSDGNVKRPEHHIAWWSRIFSFLLPDERDRLHLRFLCRLFRDALKPPPIWTTFPHSKQDPSWSSSLATLMKHLNALSKIKMNTVPTVLFVEEGVHKIKEQRVCIEYPIKMIGAGPDKTILQGYGFYIQGKKETGKRVELSGMTVRGSKGDGLFGNSGLSFLCDRMIFTRCGAHGVCAFKAMGKLRNCVVTGCTSAGIISGVTGLIEVEGNMTKVDGNGTSQGNYYYGLFTLKGSCIHLLLPLTKESVATNHHNGQNYGGGGTIQSVGAFAR
tara:strand:- start:134 stop:1066 length:933 start_codon:yes stop_codon:yes gene_type:complete